MVRRKPSLAMRALTAASITLAMFVALGPLYWAVTMSLKDRIDWFGFNLIPFLQFRPTLDYWTSEFTASGRGAQLATSAVNSLVLSLGAALIALGLGTPAAYALARFRFRRWKNRDITMWFLSQRFLPPVATIFPILLMTHYSGLFDTPWVLAVTNGVATMPFVVLILRDIFRDLPLELEEAALVDGASPFGAFWRVALPLSAPALVGAGVISFAFAWNEFFFALILTSQHAVPITVVVEESQESAGIIFAKLAARVLIAMLPPLVVAVLAQRYIVRGLTFGAVKG
jgi:multiple sugar transport system permease protein